MRIHEFGTEHEKTVLLLHSACLSWRMFQPAAERLQTQYHLIIPALPAHDPDEKTPYTSVEAIAAELERVDGLHGDPYKEEFLYLVKQLARKG